MSNIFLYDLADDADLPAHRLLHRRRRASRRSRRCCRWAREADRLAFVYYENQKFDVYTHHQPARRSSGRRTSSRPSTASSILARVATPPLDTTRSLQVREDVRVAGRRGRLDLPHAAGLPLVGRPGPDRRHDAARASRSPSARCSIRPTTACPTPASSRSRSTGCTSRPTTSRGRRSATRATTSAAASSAASAISLSDMLGNHQLVFAGYVNGRISEAQVAGRVRQPEQADQLGGRREPGSVLLPRAERDRRRPAGPGDNIFITNIRRLVVRSVFGQAYYPISRFQRIEASLRFANVDDALLQINEPYDPSTGFATAGSVPRDRQPRRA